MFMCAKHGWGVVSLRQFFVIGVVWDSFTIWRGHWLFPAGKNLGIVIGNMPLEEYLFALIVSSFILTIYKVFDARLTKHRDIEKR